MTNEQVKEKLGGMAAISWIGSVLLHLILLESVTLYSYQFWTILIIGMFVSAVFICGFYYIIHITIVAIILRTTRGPNSVLAHFLQITGIALTIAVAATAYLASKYAFEVWR